MKIIAVSGFIGSGKDTVADYLLQCYGFQRESLAKSLKDATADIFGWDRDLLEGTTTESRIWREQVDSWWSEKLNIPNITPRYILQILGTEVFRNNFHNDIWVLSLEKRLISNNSNIVITDCRFTNEINMVKRIGGKIIWIRRGDLPEWYDLAVEVNSVSPEKLLEIKEKYKVHDSEFKWVGTDFDYVLFNDGSLTDLYKQIDKMMDEI